MTKHVINSQKLSRAIAEKNPRDALANVALFLWDNAVHNCYPQVNYTLSALDESTFMRSEDIRQLPV